MSLHTFPNSDEYAEYYGQYIQLAKVDDIKDALRKNRDAFLVMFSDLDKDKMEFRYRDGAWDLKELIQHVTDAERVFAYRALCIARGDEGPFPGFDENNYVEVLDLQGMSKEQLIYDFVMSRNSFISLLTNLHDVEWSRKGVASGHTISVRALAHATLGHCMHHMAVIKERYLA